MGLLHPGACLHRPSLELVSPVFTGHLRVFLNDDYRHCLTVIVKFFWKLDLRFDFEHLEKDLKGGMK